MKKTLLGLGQEADLVLDLHCDSEAVVHLYTHTRSAEEFAPLSALIGAHAYLLADVSGDEPFDEACSRPWAELADRFSGSSDPLRLPLDDPRVPRRAGCRPRDRRSRCGRHRSIT